MSRAPAPDTGLPIRGDVRDGIPAGRPCTGIEPPRIQAASPGTRRVAFRAMGQGPGQVGTTVPLFCGLGARLELAGAEVQEFPEAQYRTEARVPDEFVLAVVPADRLDRLQIRPKRGHILGTHPRIGGVGKGGVVVPPPGTGSMPERASEVLLAPAANPGLGVGGDVGSVEGAERTLDGPPSGQEGCVVGLFRVTGDATAGAQQVFALSHRVRCHGVP